MSNLVLTSIKMYHLVKEITGGFPAFSVAALAGHPIHSGALPQAGDAHVDPTRRAPEGSVPPRPGQHHRPEASAGAVRASDEKSDPMSSASQQSWNHLEAAGGVST